MEINKLLEMDSSENEANLYQSRPRANTGVLKLASASNTEAEKKIHCSEESESKLDAQSLYQKIQNYLKILINSTQELDYTGEELNSEDKMANLQTSPPLSDHEWAKFLCNSVGLEEDFADTLIKNWHDNGIDPTPENYLQSFFEARAGKMKDCDIDVDFLSQLGFNENKAGNSYSGIIIKTLSCSWHLCRGKFFLLLKNRFIADVSAKSDNSLIENREPYIFIFFYRISNS